MKAKPELQCFHDLVREDASVLACRNAFKSFAPDMTGEDIIKAKGRIPMELYRLASGMKEIQGVFVVTDGFQGKGKIEEESYLTFVRNWLLGLRSF